LEQIGRAVEGLSAVQFSRGAIIVFHPGLPSPLQILEMGRVHIAMK
jgi:hypothetical protein